MSYPDYLIHFNKLHSKSNGQFIRGDGDGDGTTDEHHRYSKGKEVSSEQTYRLKWGDKQLLNYHMNGSYKTGDKITQKQLKKYLPTKKQMAEPINESNSNVKYTQMKMLKKISKTNPEYKDSYNSMKKQWDAYAKVKNRQNRLEEYNRASSAMTPGSVINTQVRSYAFGKFLSSDGYKHMNTGEKYISTQLASYTLSRIFK